MKKALLGVGNGIRIALAVATISLLGNLQAMAATNLFWSSNGTTQGAAGTWNTTTGHFSSANANPYSTVWNNANVDSAEFGGTAGQVNLAGPIVVNTIQTDLTGFNIGNANAAGAVNTITFSGANAGVNVVGAGNTTTISAVMNGTVTKSGAGRMELGNGTNPNTIKYVLTGGSLTSASIARTSGTAPGSLVSDFFTFNGGGWAINTGNQDTGANRGVTIKSGGAFFGTSSTTVNTTISSPIVGTEGGDLTATNAGPFTGVASSAAGGVVTLNNTGNSWNGNANIGASSTIRLGQAGVVPDTAIVNLTGAGGLFDLNGFSETVKSVSGTAGTIALGSAGKLTLNNPTGQTYSSVLTGTVGSQLIKNGAGAFTLSGSSTGFSGEIVLNNGTLGIGGANSLGSNAAGPVFTVNGGTISNNSATGRTIASTVSTNINANFIADDSLAASQGQIAFSGISTMKSGGKTFTINGATTNIAFADLREDTAGSGVTKDGTGILALTGTNTANAFTGDVTILNGKLQVSGTSIIGTGNNLLKLAGGTLTSSASRTISTNPISNPISVTADSSITTLSTAATVNMALTTNSITAPAGKTLTLRNDGGADATKTFFPRLSGSGFDIQSNVVIADGATGAKTQLELANTGATTQTISGTISGPGSLHRTTGAVGTGNGGDAILKGNNTYSGGTILDEGKIGFGSSSTATTGPIGTGGLTIAQSTTGVYASGGARTVSNAVSFNNVTAGSGTEFSGSNDLEMSGGMNLGAVSRTLTVSNTGKTTLSGVISDVGGTAGITKSGPGVLVLTNANTYGTVGVTSTTVSAGKLLVNNTTGSGTGPGDVLVNGGILGGTGTIAGSVSVTSGDLSPGASINVLSIGGNLSMTGGSFDYEINRDTATADLNNVTGSLSLASVALSASDLGVGALPLAMGTKFTLINYGGLWNGGIFTGLPNHSTTLTIGLNRFAIEYADTTGGSNFGGGSVGAGSKFVTITAVPEATAFLTIGLGGIFAIAAVRMGKRMGINVLKA